MSFLSHINPFGKGNQNPLDPSNAIHAVQHAADSAINSAVHKVEQTVEDKLKDVADSVAAQIKDELHDLEKDLEDVIVKGLLALAGETMKPGLALGAKIARKTDQLFGKLSDDTLADIAKAPFVLPVSVGVVSIGFYFYGLWGGDRLHALADDLDRYSHTGIGATRHDIIKAVTDFGPDHVDIGVGVKFDLGVSFGITPSIWSIPTKPFLEIADELMREAGVP